VTDVGEHYGFEGDQLTFGWALALCSWVGFSHGHGLLRAAATMHGESMRWTAAWHENLADDGVTVTSTDRGLFQVNSMHESQLSAEDALKAIPNAQFAWQLSEHGKDFTRWYAYKNRSIYYEEGLEWARWYYINGKGWRKRIERVPLVLGEEP
jgi:lysozyme-like protein